MHSLITSYLLQHKECILPGIGVLQFKYQPAVTDANNSRIIPPSETIIFKKEDQIKSPELINYIAVKKQIKEAEAEGLLNNFLKEWKETINAGEKLHFETLGSIQKNADGEIFFEKDNSLEILHPVTVETMYQGGEKPMRVDEQPVLTEINEYKKAEEIVVERSHWGIWALILFSIGLVMLFFHFKDHKITPSNIGNQQKFKIGSVGNTYHLPGEQ